MLSRKYAFIVLLLLFIAAGCSQEPQDFTIPMKGGDYELKITKTVGGIEDPVERKFDRCYPRTVFDPYTAYHENKDCKISNVVKTSNSVSFDVNCKNGARANAKGKMEYSVKGETIKWKTTFTSIGGNDIDAVTTGIGTYQGKCK